MATIVILLLGCIALGLLALRWGVDSTEGIDSPEWERRSTWPTFNTTNQARNTRPHVQSNGHHRLVKR